MINTSNSIAECITRWGSSSSVALLDPACEIFRSTHIPGMIGYKQQAKHIIVFGDPLCDPAHRLDFMTEFHQQFEADARNIIYLATSKAFAEDSLHGPCQAAIAIGQEIILDPTHDPRSEKGDRASLLRGKCNQAIRHKVTVHEYTGSDPTLEKAMEVVAESWVNGREGPQIYLHHVDIFSHRDHKRFFYAECEGKIVGVLILNRMDAHGGWLMSLSLVDRSASKGTSELLIVSCLEMLAKEGCHYFSIGTVPVSAISEIQGLGFVKSFFVRSTYRCAKKIFHLGDRECYWTKFHPRSEETYLVLSKPKLGMGSVLGIMSALNASHKAP
jgi:lysylphosphatidylglycerol synthetase-like protein (DUF2156 family)